MANPVLLHLPLRENLEGRDRNGVVTATASGPVRFTADGYYAEEATTNLLPNPSAESALAPTNWSARGVGTSAVRTTDDAYSGSYSIRVSGDATAVRGLTHASTTIAAVQGETFTFQCAVKLETGSSVSVRIGVQERNGAGAFLVESWTTPVALTTAWQVLSYTYSVTQATAATIGVQIETSPTAACSYLFDAAQLEKKAYATSYCDGSLGTGYSWSGTAHASASSRAASYAYVSETARIAAAAGSIALRLTRKTDTGANQTLIDVGDGTASKDRLTVRVNSSDQAQMAWASNGAAATTVTEPDPTATVDTERIVYAEWDATDTGISVDNTTLVTGVRDAAQGDLSSANDLLIGALAGGSAYADSQISDLLIFDRPLTNAERVNLAAIDEWSFDVLQPKFGGVLRIGTGIGLAISSVAAPAAVAVARTLGGL